jgi:hypothetical protein
MKYQRRMKMKRRSSRNSRKMRMNLCPRMHSKFQQLASLRVQVESAVNSMK